MAADAQNPGANQAGADPSGGTAAGDAARLQELSRKLLDLWQDHLSAVAQDPNLLAQALKLMTAAPLAWMPGFPATGFPSAGFAAQGGQGFAQSANPFQSGFFAGGFAQPAGDPGAKAGPAPAAAASAAGADDVGQLRRRLAELEGRLAQLEGGEPGAGSRGGKAAAGAGKPRRRAAKS